LWVSVAQFFDLCNSFRVPSGRHICSIIMLEICRSHGEFTGRNFSTHQQVDHLRKFMLKPKENHQGHHFIKKVTSLIFALILFTFPGLLAGEDMKDRWAARQIYLENCAACHGFDRTGFIGTSLVPAELKTRSQAAVRSLIRHGIDGTLMPAQSCRLSLKKLRRLSYYLKETPAEIVKRIKIGSDGNYEIVKNKMWQRDPKRIKNGRSLFDEYCMGCHHPTIEAFAPAYSEISAKRDIRAIMGQIRFPYTSSLILGYTDQIMPVFDLTNNEIKNLGAYVYSFRK